MLGTRSLPDLPQLGEGRRPDLAILPEAKRADVDLGAVRRVPGLTGEKIATLRMIDALCNGNLNSPARRYWTCEALAFQAAWAGGDE
jgi:hypothetical protein